MNPTAHAVPHRRSSKTTSSPTGLGGASAKMRSRFRSGRRRIRFSSRTIPAISQRRKLLLLPCATADDDRDEDEDASGNQPRDDPLGNRPKVAQSPPPAVVGILRQQDVADDRIELPVADLLLREARHQVRADPDRL